MKHERFPPHAQRFHSLPCTCRRCPRPASGDPIVTRSVRLLLGLAVGTALAAGIATTRGETLLVLIGQ